MIGDLVGKKARLKWHRRQQRYQADYELTKQPKPWPYRKLRGWLYFKGDPFPKTIFFSTPAEDPLGLFGLS